MKNRLFHIIQAGFLCAGIAVSLSASATPAPPDIINGAGCLSCHTRTEKLVGPAFDSVAKRYKDDADAVATLVNKVRYGGNGNWGRISMPAHPNLSDADLTTLVKWVLDRH